MATCHSSIDAFVQTPSKKSQGLADESLGRRFSNLASQILEFLEEVDTSTSRVSQDDVDPNVAAIARLKKIVAARAVRNRLFAPDLFADPAWDVMLDLAIAKAEGRRISVSSLCIAANVPTTTALRQIKAMVAKGLLIIVEDRGDGRRKYVSISDDTYETVIKYAVLTM